MKLSRSWRWLCELGLALFLWQVIEIWQAPELDRGPWPLQGPQLPLLDPRLPPEEKSQAKLVYVFAPWCGVCLHSAGNLNALREKNYAVEALALSYGSPDEVKAFVAETGLKIPVRMGTEEDAERLQISAFPSYFLLDEQANIKKAWTGYTTQLGLSWKLFWFGTPPPSAPS